MPTFAEGGGIIANNKLASDDSTHVTKSFNLAKGAEITDAENLLIIKSDEVAKLYKDNWKSHREHLEVLEARY